MSRVTIRDIQKLKGDRPIVSLTSYTAPLARIVDRHADLILVGDSLGMVLYGMESTLPVSMDMMVLHTQAVVQATERALVVFDMPFGSYQESKELAFRHAAEAMKRTGCQAVKMEGGAELAETVLYLTQRGIPVLGHIGLKPQSVNAEGGYRVTGRAESERERILEDAKAIEQAGAFGLVIECTAENVARKVSETCKIPTIGIGASAACDGQILVAEDMLGLSGDHVPKFVKKYADLASEIDKAVENYAGEVKERVFPDHRNVYDQKVALYSSGGKKKVS